MLLIVNKIKFKFFLKKKKIVLYEVGTYSAHLSTPWKVGMSVRATDMPIMQSPVISIQMYLKPLKKLASSPISVSQQSY